MEIEMKTLRFRHSSFLPAGLVPRWRTEERAGHLLSGFGWFVTFSYDAPDVWICEMGPFPSEEVALETLDRAVCGAGTIDRLVAMGCDAMLELCDERRAAEDERTGRVARAGETRVVPMAKFLIGGWYLQYLALVAEHRAETPCRSRVKQ
jgi:hypothetical protein